MKIINQSEIDNLEKELSLRDLVKEKDSEEIIGYQKERELLLNNIKDYKKESKILKKQIRKVKFKSFMKGFGSGVIGTVIAIVLIM